MKLNFILFLICLLVVGCDVFSTRTPEQPSDNNSVFIPPTEPYLVISNFEDAIKNKNLDNYLKCFNNTNFKFFPSQLASSYFSIFSNWSYEQERQYFNSLNINILHGSSPMLNWYEKQPIFENLDSAVFESLYKINFEFNDKSIPTEYHGKIRLVMKLDKNGLWNINSWYDYNNTQQDSTYNSWSMLKAKLYN